MNADFSRIGVFYFPIYPQDTRDFGLRSDPKLTGIETTAGMRRLMGSKLTGFLMIRDQCFHETNLGDLVGQ